MRERSLDEVRQLWRETPDNALKKAATKNLAEYPPEIQQIIQEEAKRRSIELPIENVIIPKQKQSTTEASSGEKNHNVKTPFSTRFLRGLCIIWFLVAIQINLLAIVLFRDGLKLPAVVLFLGATSTLLSVLLIRRFSVKISEYAPHTGDSYDGWLIVIVIAAIVVWGEAVPIMFPSFVFFLAFLVGFFGAIGVLFKSRLFYLRNYVIAGLGIASCLASIQYPALIESKARAQSIMRNQEFANIIDECRGLVSSADFETAMSQTDVLNHIPDAQGSTLILMADDKIHPPKLQVAIWEGYISKQLLVPKEMSPKMVLIVGPVKKLLDPSLHTKAITLGAPVLFFSWPEKEKVGSAIIKATYRRRSSDSDLWGVMFRRRQFASQLEQIVTAK